MNSRANDSFKSRASLQAGAVLAQLPGGLGEKVNVRVVSLNADGTPQVPATPMIEVSQQALGAWGLIPTAVRMNAYSNAISVR